MDKKCKVVLVVLAIIMAGALVYCVTNIKPKIIDPQAEIVASAKEKLKEICSRFGALPIDFAKKNIFFTDLKEEDIERGEYLPEAKKIIVYKFSDNEPAYSVPVNKALHELEQTVILTHELVHAQCSNFGKENYSAFWIEGMTTLITSAGFNPEELEKTKSSYDHLGFGLYYGLKISDIYRIAELISQKTNTGRDKVVNYLVKLFLQNDTHMFDEYIDSALGKDTCKTYFKNVSYTDPFAAEVEAQEVRAIDELYIKNGVGKVSIEYPSSLFGRPRAKNGGIYSDDYTPKKNR